MNLFITSKFMHILMLILLIEPCHGLFEWLYGENRENELKSTPGQADMKYEVVTTDDKFLEFAKTLNELKPLDACHNIVVYNLKRKCGELSEEELGKLAVQLFNCQAEAENRPTFLCTSDMTLAACTKDMDSTTWNGYQIVGNRARAMCYATQQLQFQKLTERAVNNLAISAYNHLESMKEIKDGQQQIHSLTTDTVRKLFESQQDLLTTHESLKSAHQTVFTHVADNVKQLVHEKSLIATGNKELAEMTENIREKLDMTSEHLKNQEKQQRENHEKILQDLKEIQKKSQDALRDLSGRTKQLISNHEEMMTQYQVMFKNLQKMNNSINGLLKTVSDMQEKLEKKLGWVSKLLGGADDKLHVIICCIHHIVFFLLMVIIAAFLQLPVLLRTILLMLIAVNAGCEINYNKSLGFTVLFVITSSTIIAHWTIVWIRWQASKVYGTNKLTYTSGQSFNSREIRELTSVLGRLQQSLNDNLDIDPSNQHCNGNSTSIPYDDRNHLSNITPSPVRHTSITPSPVNRYHHTSVDPIPEVGENQSHNLSQVRRLLINQMGDGPGRTTSRSSTPLSSRNSSRSATPLLGIKCKGVTRAGSSCRMPASSGFDYCYRHR
ncbi:hypothetical protein SNE40_014391 [Patella caerulea]|uniref:Protein brambleberry n=1 Tax=Patella caerulea TaxID=87958 RepID=A0AAN8JDE6_PATCE